MALSTEQLNHWHHTLNCSLKGRQWKKHYSLVISNLVSVSRGVKLAYLWDCGPSVETKVIEMLVLDLKSKNLLHQAIHVISVCQDVFVAHRFRLREYLENVFIECKFIDVSGDLNEPKLLNSALASIHDMVHELLYQLDLFNKSDERSSLTLIYDESSNWNLPTLFGLLLGYPIVYWSSEPDGENCLPFVLLKVFKVRISGLCEGQRDFELFSFSAPECLGMDSHVMQWFFKLKEQCSISEFTVEIQTSTTTLKSVTL